MFRLSALIVVPTLATVLGAPASAAAAPPPQIVSPANGQSLSGQMKLQVRAPRGARTYVDGREVTRRLRRAPGGLLTATLRPGRDFPRGEGQVTVSVGEAGAREQRDSANFIALRNDESLLRIRRHVDRSGRSAVQVRGLVARRLRKVSVRLNGRTVSGALAIGRAAGRFNGSLGADDGLRFGSNRLVIRGERGGGRVDREVREITIPRTAPLVGADVEDGARVGRIVSLDGTSSKASRRGRQLIHRWRVIEKPPGSQAHAIRSGSARAGIFPDKPGTYRIRLTVTEAAKGAAAKLAQATPLAPLTPPPCSEQQPDPFTAPTSPECLKPPPFEQLEPLPDYLQGKTAVDEILFHAPTSSAPMGMPVQTIAADNSVRVGSNPPSPPKGNWVHVLTYNPFSMEPIKGGDKGYDVQDADQLASDVKNMASLPTPPVVIISGQGNSFADQNGRPINGWSSGTVKSLTEIVEGLGGTVDNLSGGANGLIAGDWSLIGYAGLARGQAWQNNNRQQTGLPGFGQPAGDPGRDGSLNGYMQPLPLSYPEPVYSFVSPEAVELDTNAGEPADGTIVVGDDTYSPPFQAQIANGWNLVILDGGSLELLKQVVVNTDDGTTPNPANLQQLTSALDQFLHSPGSRANPPLVILQSVGTPSQLGMKGWLNESIGSYQGAQATGPSHWYAKGQTLAGQMGELAGQSAHDVFANLNASGTPTQGYSLVASARTLDPESMGYSRRVELVNKNAANYLPSADVVGALVRNHQGQWEVNTAGTGVLGPQAGTATGPTQLQKILYRAPTPFPYEEQGTPGNAALLYITGRLRALGIAIGTGVTDVREEYVDPG